MPKPSFWNRSPGPSCTRKVPPRQVTTLLWSASHPMADAVPSAPVKASVLTLKLQRYAGPGPGDVAEVTALALAPAGGSRVRVGVLTASEETRTSTDQVTGRAVALRHLGRGRSPRPPPSWACTSASYRGRPSRARSYCGRAFDVRSDGQRPASSVGEQAPGVLDRGSEHHLDGVGGVPVDGRLDGLPVVIECELVRHDDGVGQQAGGQHVECAVDGMPTRSAGQSRR